MNRRLNVLVGLSAVAMVAVGSFSFAQDANKPSMAMEKEMPAMVPGKAAPAKPAMGMGMNMDKSMAPMQDNVKKMEQQMDAIHKTTDAKARNKLMHEHMQTMEANMKAMRSMGSPKSNAASGVDAASRQEMMEKRMDMMQTMMEQMMQREKAMEPMPHM